MVSVGARLRSARLRAVRLRRRRAAACHGAGTRTRPAARAGAGPAGHHQRAGLRGRRYAARFRQHGQPAGCQLLDEARNAVDPGAPARRGRGADRQGSRAARGDPLHPFGRHAVRRADAHHQRAAALGRVHARRCCRALFEKAYFARFSVELPEIRANLVNLNTSVTGVRPARRSVAADRSGAAAPRRSARHAPRSAPSGSTAFGSTRRSMRAKNCRSTR